MRVEVLGPIQVRPVAEGEEPTAPAGALQRHALALLVAAAGRPVAAEVLSDSLWGADRDDHVTGRLQVTITRLRRFLGGKDAITYGPLGYTLEVGPISIDAQAFDRLLDRALGTDRTAEEAIEQLTAALALWRGPAYQGVTDPVVEIEVQRLAERRLDACQTLARALLATGEPAKAADLLEPAVVEAPWREDLAATRMAALVRLGRQADAVALYHAVRERLATDLGLDPGPELAAAFDAILHGAEPEMPEVAATTIPAQLPPRPGRFSGREAALAALDNALLQPPLGAVPIAVLAGPGGVGKSALALQWAHAHRDDFPDGQLHLDLRGWSSGSPVAPETALTRMLRGLGAEVPGTGLEDCRDAYRTAVHNRRLLIMLDNAASTDQVRDLLPGSPSCAVLVTSRDQLTGLSAHEGAARLELERLTEAESLTLLQILLPALDGAAGLGELARLCAGLPLALRIAAEYLASRPALGLDGLLSELTDGATRLDILDGDDQAGVRAVFDRSYARLDPAAAATFQAMGVLPAPDVDLGALAAVTGQSMRHARVAVRALVAAHLVEERPGRPGHPRFGLHDLLAAYAAERHSETGASPSAIIDTLLEHYMAGFAAANALLEERTKVEADDPVVAEAAQLAATTLVAAPSFGSAAEASEWLRAEMATAVATAAAASPATDRLLCAGAALLSGYVQGDGQERAGAAIQRLAVAAASRLGDRVAQVRRVNELGIYEALLGRVDAAADSFATALELLGDGADQPQRSRLLNNLALIHGWCGRYQHALGLIDEGMRLEAAEVAALDARGDADAIDARRPDMARSGMTRVYLLVELQRYDEAQATLQHVSAWCDPARDQLTGLALLQATAELARVSGDHVTAVEVAQHRLRLAQQLGLVAEEGRARNELGVMLVSSGRPEAAIPEHRWALREARASGNAVTECEAAVRLAAALLAAGKVSQAFVAYSEAVQITRLGPLATEKLNAAVGLARAALALGRPALARESLGEAERVASGTDLDRADLDALLGELAA